MREAIVPATERDAQRYDPRLLAALARVAASVARLDQALVSHPLEQAFLYRARLEAVRRQAAADGKAIDPWHMAAMLEGLRLRMDPTVSLLERSLLFQAARTACGYYGWLVRPDFDQEGDIQAAERFLAGAEGPAPLLAAAQGVYRWIDGGGARPPVRAALVRFWRRHHFLRSPVPLTGAAALRADVPWTPESWSAVFMDAIADEAEDALQLLLTLERAWSSARRAELGRRSTSRAAAAIDVLAAVPLVSASSLGAALGMAVKNAVRLLEQFCAADIAIEVTHRARRRLFGLKQLAPLRAGVAAPRRRVLGRGRGRPRLMVTTIEPAPTLVPPLAPLLPLTPLERWSFDYSGLEAAMAAADGAMRRARQALGLVGGPQPQEPHHDGTLGSPRNAAP